MFEKTLLSYTVLIVYSCKKKNKKKTGLHRQNGNFSSGNTRGVKGEESDWLHQTEKLQITTVYNCAERGKYFRVVWSDPQQHHVLKSSDSSRNIRLLWA